MPRYLLLRVERLDAQAGEYPLKLFEIANGQSTIVAQSALRADLASPVQDFPKEALETADLEKVLKFFAFPKKTFEDNPEKNLDGLKSTTLRGKILELYADRVDESKYYEPLGKYLHSLLFPSGIQQKWSELTAAATAAKPVTTLLEFSDDLLRKLPWELMIEGKDRLFLDDSRPVARTYEWTTKFLESPDSEHWPMRMLVVVGCTRDDPIAWRLELDFIEAAVHQFGPRVDYLPLISPDHDRVLDALEELEPHIFHFIGHGVKKDDDGHLLLGKYEWKVDEILTDFKPYAQHLRLVVLNCCHSNTPGGVEGTWAVSEVFHRAKTPAVIGMQGDVLGGVAANFGQRFYEKLEQELPIDVAVTQARNQIRRFKDEEGTIRLTNREWSLPQLYLACQPDEVLPFRMSCMKKDLRSTDYLETTYHVDRFPVRKKIYHKQCWLYDLEDAAVALILGADGVGKSNFLQRCLSVCALRGHIVSLVDFATLPRNDTPSDVYHILNYVLEGDQENLFRRPLENSQKQFGAFYQLARELNIAVPADRLPPQPPALSEGRDNLERDMIRAFLQSAKQIAGANPLVLAFDNAEKHPASQTIVAALARIACEITHPRFHPLRMVLTTRIDAGGKQQIDVKVVANKLTLERFETKELQELTELFYCLREHRKPDRRPRVDVEELTRFLSKKVRGPWTARDVFGAVEKLVQL